MVERTSHRRGRDKAEGKERQEKTHLSENQKPQDPNPYRQPSCGGSGTIQTLTARLISSIGLIAIPTVLLPFVIGFLYSLATAPYRPPHDMTSLLGAGEVETVYLIAAVLGLSWLLCFSVLVARVREVLLPHKRQRSAGA